MIMITTLMSMTETAGHETRNSLHLLSCGMLGSRCQRTRVLLFFPVFPESHLSRGCPPQLRWQLLTRVAR